MLQSFQDRMLCKVPATSWISIFWKSRTLGFTWLHSRVFRVWDPLQEVHPPSHPSALPLTPSHLLNCTSLRQGPLALSFIVRLWGVVGQGFIRGPKHSLSRALGSARSSCWISRSQAKSWAWWCLLVVPGLQRWRRRQDRLCSPLPSKPS